MSILAVIPARGGSKGLPGKNIMPLCGKPLIVWTIEAALGASCGISDVVVSTDDDAISSAAVAAGALVPFRRPEELAADDTPTLPVIQHAVREMEAARGEPYGWVLTLQPTSPLRTARDIDVAVSLATDSKPACDSVISVTERPGEHPRLAKYVEGGALKPFVGESLEGVRRQDCRPPAVFNNGAIYLTRRSVLMDRGAILGDRALACPMPRERSIDIDDMLDFQLAELILSAGGRA
ncbi:MAG: acylneuraminate cytidylyltransferase family protein [Alphaproteobacteria bacterium]